LTGIEQVAFSVDNGGPPTGSPVEIRVIGSDDNIRTRLIDDVVGFLNTIEGVKDVDRTDKGGKEEITISLNHERLARYGVTVADVAQNVRIAYDGEVVTSVRYGEDDVDFRVILAPEYRQQLQYVKQLRIPNQRGELIALDEVASLNIITSPTEILHHEGERVVTITGDVLQEKITPVEVMSAVQQRFDVYKAYPGMRIDIGGEAEESRKAMFDLYITFGIAALGVYFLLMLLFNSATQPLMVIIAIPFGICGVIVTFALHGQPFSFLSMLGVIGMAGVVVNDSLVLVDHLNTLKRTANVPVLSGVEGSFANTRELFQLVATGTANRLRPVLLTTFTTVAGLLPLAYGLGGQDMYMSPMALALGYGLLFATPLTLVLVPSFYVIGYDIKRVFKRSRESEMNYTKLPPEILMES
jgi:multidrug efflux pump subunit AcrB